MNEKISSSMKKYNVDILSKKNISIFLISTILLSLLLYTTFSFSVPFTNTNTEDNLDYNGYVCVTVNKWDPSTQSYYSLPSECDHNVLYNQGRNLTRDALSGAAANIPNIIAVINASATVAAAGADDLSTTWTEYGAVCGMTNTSGTYGVNSISPGNWTWYKTFTNSCAFAINMSAARLKNASGTMFAGNTFTVATLQQNDQISINWSLSVS